MGPPQQAFKHSPAPAMSNGGGPAMSVQEFVGKWNLGPDAQNLLAQLDPSQQSKVMQEFRPRDTSRDVSAIFCKFTQGIMEQRARGGPINTIRSYLSKWNLSPEAQAMFLSFTPQIQHKIMQEFSPRDTSRDVSNIFMKFSQGVSRGMGAQWM